MKTSTLAVLRAQMIFLRGLMMVTESIEQSDEENTFVHK